MIINMKKEIKKTINDNDSGKIIETIETNPEDGFVHEADIHNVDIHNYGKYSKGYSKSYTFTTNDTRITRPFIYGLCGLFLGIGIICLLLSNWFFGIIFILSAILIFSKAKKDIDKVEQELRKNGNYKEKLSAEEKQEYKQEVEEAFDDIKKSVFTKDYLRWLLKVSIPIYSIISIIIFIVITILVNIIVGIVALVLLALLGLIYFFVISKICKH